MSDSCTPPPWVIACQAPLSMGFSRQEDWSGTPFPPPGDLPNPGIEATSTSPAGRFFTTSARKALPKRRILPTQRLMKRTQKLLDMRGSRSWSWASVSSLCSLLWKLIFKAVYSQRKGIVCSVLPLTIMSVPLLFLFNNLEKECFPFTFPWHSTSEHQSSKKDFYWQALRVELKNQLG